MWRCFRWTAIVKMAYQWGFLFDPPYAMAWVEEFCKPEFPIWRIRAGKPVHLQGHPSIDLENIFNESQIYLEFWLLLFDVNQLFSQKWSSKVSKANFCSKTMGKILASFVLHSTSFPIVLIIIVWCQSIIFSEMKPETLKNKLLL